METLKDDIQECEACRGRHKVETVRRIEFTKHQGEDVRYFSEYRCCPVLEWLYETESMRRENKRRLMKARHLDIEKPLWLK